MANKRQLKKYFKAVAGELAGETIFMLQFYDNVDADKALDVLNQTFTLLAEKTNDVSINFDKTCQSFFNGDKKLYRKERTAYYKASYGKLYEEFNEGVKSALKNMNSLLSKEQLEKNKEIASSK